MDEHKNVRNFEEWDNISNDMRPKIRYWLPAAAIDEEDLRQEIRLLRDRGFGGVEVVVVSSLPVEILKGEDGWGTDHWNNCIKIIANETESLGMTMDIANGPMWPISMPTVESADDPAALRELTFGVIECPDSGFYKGKLPERRTVHEEGTPVLIHVMAYRQRLKGILIEDSYVDLSGNVIQEQELECSLPPCKQGEKWLIFAFYSQPALHKTGLDQYYVIDHMNKAGVKACQEYWKSILAQHPYPSMESIFCDSLEYRVCMDWTTDMELEFEKRRGYSLLPYLPFVGNKDVYPTEDLPGYQLDNPDLSEMINFDYMETLTQCYCENHLAALEELADSFGKTIRYQVAYNKPFEAERCGLYVALPENEALGRPSMDYQKLMAASVHLGRKKRYSFECSAEFGNNYGQTYEDLFWWVKRSLMSGMNAQVLHGASYSGGYKGKYSINGNLANVSWPGYEAFGKTVSNEWSRTLSISDARKCMDTISRMNTIFRKKAKIDCAIYRSSYSNSGLGSEHCFYDDGGMLSSRGYSYETVSPELLKLPVCTVREGVLDPDGVGYKCMIIPKQKRISIDFLIKVTELLRDGFPIIWEGDKPEIALYYKEWRTEQDKDKWNQLMNQVWQSKKLIHTETLQQVPELLLKNGILPEIKLDGEVDIVTAYRVDETKNIKYAALYAYNKIICSPEDPNPDELSCSALFQKGTTKSSYQRPGSVSRKKINIKIKGDGQVYLCNPWSKKIIPLDTKQIGDYCSVSISVEEDELVILAVMQGINKKNKLNMEKECSMRLPIQFNTLSLQEFLPNNEQEKSFLRSSFQKCTRDISIEELRPWRLISEDLEYFSGKGTYTGTFFIPIIEASKRYFLRLGGVSDTFRVWVNGKETDFPDQVLKKVEISDLICHGENELKIEVVSNLYNALVLDHKGWNGYHVSRIPKNYGIWDEINDPCSILVMG